jgi:tetratricopeptide (TPR) repeat protein
VANAWAVGGRHTFAEILAPDGRWLPVDIAVAQMLVPGYEDLGPRELNLFKQRRRIEGDEPGWLFGNFGSNRIILAVGNNIQFESPTLGRQITLQRMAPGGSQANPEGFRIEGLNRSVVHGGFHVFGAKARQQDLAHELAHQHLADFFFQTGVDDPAPTCSKGPEFADDGIQSWLNAGKVWMHKGEYYKAESAFKRAQQKVEGQKREKLGILAWIHNYLGNCYDMMDRREMALAEYQAVIDLNSNYRGARDYAERFLEKPFVHRIH